VNHVCEDLALGIYEDVAKIMKMKCRKVGRHLSAKEFSRR